MLLAQWGSYFLALCVFPGLVTFSQMASCKGLCKCLPKPVPSFNPTLRSHTHQSGNLLLHPQGGKDHAHPVIMHIIMIMMNMAGKGLEAH